MWEGVRVAFPHKLHKENIVTWSELWAYFKVSSKAIKADIWIQLDLERHLKGLDAKNQVIVLKNAPDDVLRLVKNCLYLETRNKLGIQEEKVLPRRIRMVIG